MYLPLNVPLPCSSVAHKQCRRRAACILFTVMDHDWLSSNDFAGEAVMPMNLICGLNELEVSGGLKNVQPTVLKLTRPKANNGNISLSFFSPLFLIFLHILYSCVPHSC